jgi:ribosome-associated protein
MNIRSMNFLPELNFSAARSSGKGGQHINKVSTKIELSFDVNGSSLLTHEQKSMLFRKLSSRISTEGILKITVQESRSQHENKRIAIKKFYALLEQSFANEKPRIATAKTKASKEKRIKRKKLHAEKKKLRSKRIEF